MARILVAIYKGNYLILVNLNLSSLHGKSSSYTGTSWRSASCVVIMEMFQEFHNKCGCGHAIIDIAT